MKYLPVKFVCDKKRHLVCIPYSIPNLHRMAEELKIPRHFFHKNHYDIPQRRLDEIMSVCYKVSSKDIVKIIRGENDVAFPKEDKE